jgi:SAM-dependent methyltransferase
MATWISGRMGQFTYFDHQLGNPDWTDKCVLDFGGNVGNILLDPKCQIEPRNYWSIDVSRDAIAEGRRRHPNAHFVFYDRYNYEYNFTGIPGLPIPNLGVRFDFIVAWSVVTHNSKAETMGFVDQLMGLLTADGKLAFTFMDPLWTASPGWARESEAPGKSNLHWSLAAHHESKADVAGLLEKAKKADLTWVNLIDDELVFDPDDDGLSVEKGGASAAAPDEPSPEHRNRRTYLSFCTPEYMSRLFPKAQIRPPVRPERHHCAIIDAYKGTDGNCGTGQSGSIAN